VLIEAARDLGRDESEERFQESATDDCQRRPSSKSAANDNAPADWTYQTQLSFPYALMMIRILYAVIALWFSAGLVSAVDLYVGQSGAVTSNCQTEATPCKTVSYAVSQVPLSSGVGYIIHIIEPGNYAGEINIVQYRVINIVGDCSNWDAVVLQPTQNSSAIVIVQDFAIGVVSCVRLDSAGHTGNGALFSRQMAILDFFAVDFGDMPGGFHYSADHAALSCTGPYRISGSAEVHATGGNSSVVHANCAVDIPAPLAFTVFGQAGFQSLTLFSGATYSGAGAGSATSGMQCIVQDGSITVPRDGSGNVLLPGNAPCAAHGFGSIW